MSYRVFLGLGSNLGTRAEYLNSAAAAIARLPGCRLLWCSSVYESDPYGNTEQGKFLNAVAEIETSLLPPALLAAVKGVEGALGRSPSVHWGPREIDIDILVYDGLVHSGEGLNVPHPDMEHRKFVLVPMMELAPDLVHPVNGMTVEEMASACRDESRVVKTTYHIRS
jgi:2-amino-4-hydroxy-6-hydroxymethyldihydropteridine diphosphokinase